MTESKKLQMQANHMADAIVDLVERTDGPVTLARIERKIQGFATKETPSWEYVVEYRGGEALIWDGMTEAGLAALQNVMSGRRVAVQPLINLVPYLLEGGFPRRDNWMPVVLLPVRAANLDTPKWRMRGSEQLLDQFMRMAAEAGERGYRRLTPSAVRITADRFAV
jgi:hypothetical protein